jgi:hypothetical protein
LTDQGPHPCYGDRGSRREKAIKRQIVSGVGENGGGICASKWLFASLLTAKIDQLEDGRGEIEPSGYDIE